MMILYYTVKQAFNKHFVDSYNQNARMISDYVNGSLRSLKHSAVQSITHIFMFFFRAEFGTIWIFRNRTSDFRAQHRAGAAADSRTLYKVHTTGS